jgi:hypothetical protein|tara:strand:- start:1916 stop:2101 length:186 start_codon:yes stop_codon:yes gene_type:complete
MISPVVIVLPLASVSAKAGAASAAAKTVAEIILVVIMVFSFVEFCSVSSFLSHAKGSLGIY